MTDPGISTHESSTEKIDNDERIHPEQLDPSCRDTSVGPPREGRWGGANLYGKSVRRDRAVAHKKRYCSARKAGIVEEREVKTEGRGTVVRGFARDSLEAGGELWRYAIGVSPLLVTNAADELAELTVRAAHLLGTLAHVQAGGYASTTATWGELAAALKTSDRSVRRSMAQLIAAGHVVEVVRLYDRHGAAHSERAVVYAVVGTLVDGIARAHARAARVAGQFGQPSRKGSGESSPSGRDSPVPEHESSMAVQAAADAPSAPSVAPAEPAGIDFRRAVPCAGTDEPATPSVKAPHAGPPLRAPEGGGVEPLPGLPSALLRELMASGEAPDFAAELAAEMRRREVYGHKETLVDRMRSRELAHRSELIAGGRDTGGES